MSQTTFRPTPSRVDERILEEKKAAARSKLPFNRDEEPSSQFRDRARDAGRFIRSRASEGASFAADRSRAGAAQLADTIRRHPMPAMAIGLGLGIVISRLLRRR